VPESEATAGQQTFCPIVELRQYTLVEGGRDRLIELFDREFVETQEVCGMRVIGQFRDLDRPDRFVWLRGFSDMISRADALATFYGGPVWKAHREAANATMIDSNNVLLLQPATPASGFADTRLARQRDGVTNNSNRIIGATIHYFDAAIEDQFHSTFERTVRPAAESFGGNVLGYFISERSENTFPQLPVRQGENVFVWFAQFRDGVAYDNFREHFRNMPGQIPGSLGSSIEMLKLSPTSRSALS
jgi:hypothetical protein